MILSFRTDRPGQAVQTQIRLLSSLIRVYTVCHSVCIVWTHYSMVEPHSSNFRVITTNFLGVRIFRKFTVFSISEAEEEDLDSDEENEIMREIKAEITNNVRQEMNSELEVYKTKMESLEKGAAEGKGTDDKGNEDLEHLEPKLRDAFIKMRKLDKVLAKRVRREKEVKRDRILLERR